MSVQEHAQNRIEKDAPGRKGPKRRPPDQAQGIRLLVQAVFLLVNFWIGVQFYLWVRYYESGGEAWEVSRPPGVEGWLPIASLMNLKVWIATGRLPETHPAGMFILGAFLLISLIFSKSFCSWLCPVGTLSEALYKFGQRMLGRNLVMPRRLDIALRGIKYLLLAFFLWAVGLMSAASIRGFLEGPYGIVADVRMLNFFRNASLTTATAIAALVLLSALFRNFWCRYACPYGALMGLVSLPSPVRVRRNPGLCIDCAKCAKVCPSMLPVDRFMVVRSAECTACYECISACPADRALEMMLGRKRRLRAAVVAVGIGVIFTGLVAAARLTGNWERYLPDSLYFQLVPQADRFMHP